MKAVFIIFAGLVASATLGATIALGLTGWLVAIAAAAIFAASLWDFGMATTGHYCATLARPAAWWSIWSGLVLALTILFWL